MSSISYARVQHNKIHHLCILKKKFAIKFAQIKKRMKTQRKQSPSMIDVGPAHLHKILLNIIKRSKNGIPFILIAYNEKN